MVGAARSRRTPQGGRYAKGKHAREGAMTSVGIIINSESGHDVRRLVSAATVVDNAEKGAMAARLMAGLGAAGVDEVLLMPVDGTVTTPMMNLLRTVRLQNPDGMLPELSWVDMPITVTALDTQVATDLMVAAGVSALCVLGGDGTQRLVVGHLGDVPFTPLSTGTNNAFPRWVEATVAGLATGRIATGQVPADTGCVREHAFVVECGDRLEHALVDVAVTRSLFTATRAVWRPDDIEEVLAVFTDPQAIGLSSIASAVASAPRGEPVAVRVAVVQPRDAECVVTAPIAPGLVMPVGVRDIELIGLGESVRLPAGRGAISVDGERAIERPRSAAATVRLVPGPLRIDVGRVLHAGLDATSLQPVHS